METKIFDKVVFEIGDIVIEKYKDDNIKAHTVRMVRRVTNKTGFSYFVLFFNNDNTFHIAYEYEPYDKDERIKYYKMWNRNIPKQRKSKSVKKVSKQLKFNINDIKR